MLGKKMIKWEDKRYQLDHGGGGSVKCNEDAVGVWSGEKRG